MVSTDIEMSVLVSVVIPTYARSEMLLRALSSINQQTYFNIEIVLVDDNGEGTPQQIENANRIKGLTFREGVTFKYIKNQINCGGAGARNVGISEASGEYIAFLDDDDEYLPEKIEKQMAVMTADQTIDITYSHCKAINDDSGEISIYSYVFNGNVLFEQAYYGCIAATSQWLARRTALLNAGCFTITPAKQDSIMLYKMLLNGCSVGCVPYVLSVYHEHEKGRISSSGKTLDGELRYSELIRDSYSKYSLNQKRKLEHAIRYRLGVLFWKNKKIMRAVFELATSFFCAPILFTKRVVSHL